MSEPRSSDGTLRGFLPDAVKQDSVFLFKVCSQLRLTHEIRLAAFMAQQSGKRLRLIIRGSTSVTAGLHAFAAQQGISVERKS